MHHHHMMIGCALIAAVVALALFAFGAPAGVFAFVIICPLMMVAMMFVMTNAMRSHDRAPKH